MYLLSATAFVTHLKMEPVRGGLSDRALARIGYVMKGLMAKAGTGLAVHRQAITIAKTGEYVWMECLQN